MPNSLDPDGRGLPDRQPFTCGVAAILVSVLVVSVPLVKSTGRLNNYVRVVAELVNVGDRLPAKSDVKFQGVLVGLRQNSSGPTATRPT